MSDNVVSGMDIKEIFKTLGIYLIILFIANLGITFFLNELVALLESSNVFYNSSASGWATILLGNFIAIAIIFGRYAFIMEKHAFVLGWVLFFIYFFILSNLKYFLPDLFISSLVLTTPFFIMFLIQLFVVSLGLCLGIFLRRKLKKAQRSSHAKIH